MMWLLLCIIVIGLCTLSSGLFFLRPRPLAYLLDLSDLPFTQGRKREPVNGLALNDLDAFIQSEFERQPAPGAAVALVHPGRVTWTSTYGVSNVTDQTPVTSDTAFALGSVSKTVIAVALMQAIETGALALDTPINTVLPFAVETPSLEQAVPITVWHLATHTSGIQDRTLTYMQCYQSTDVRDQLGNFLNAYLVVGGAHYNANGNFLSAAPGTEIEYTNIGSALLAYVIECATGIPFAQYTHQKIFEPLGMKRTAWFASDISASTDVAMRYSRLKRPYGHLGCLTWPDGFLHSSITDLSRFLAAIMNKGELDGVRILDAESVDNMLADQLAHIEQEDGEMQALIWNVENGLMGHNGGDPGVFTLMYFDPKTERGAIVLLNSMTGKSIRAAGNILKQVLVAK